MLASDSSDPAKAKKIESLLLRMAQDGNALANEALVARGHTFEDDGSRSAEDLAARNSHVTNKTTSDDNIHESKENSKVPDGTTKKRKSSSSEKKKTKKKTKNFGSLFKKSASASSSKVPDSTTSSSKKDEGGDAEEHSDEYWDEQRAKLGLKPLRK